MPEENKTVELKDEELNKVTGGTNITHVMWFSKCGFTSSEK